MKKQSLECVFEYVGRKSIILYGDVCRYGAISGTHIAIVEFLEEVIDLEKHWNTPKMIATFRMDGYIYG